MANLPDPWKYNPMEVDSDGWVPHRDSSSMNKPAKKTCVLCMHAPVILYLGVTVAGYVAGNITNLGWLFAQLLLGLYVHLGNIKKSS